MRLFLSSQGLGAAPGELVDLLRGRTAIAVIANGAYLGDLDKRRRRIDSDIRELRAVGLDPAELDLRDYFGQRERLRSELQRFDAVWVLGGNGVVLRTAFSASGADDIVRDRLADDTLVYAGYSAGACLLGPAFPPWNELAPGELPGYPDQFVTTGLDLVPFTVAPHFGSAPAVVDYFIENHVPFIALRDGEAVVIDGESLRVVGASTT